MSWLLVIAAAWLPFMALGYKYARYCWLEYLERHPELGPFDITDTLKCLIFSLSGPFFLVVAIRKRLKEGASIRFSYKEKGRP